jgi:hypothetical protein
VAASAAPQEAEVKGQESGEVEELRKEITKEPKEEEVKAGADKGDDGGRADDREG